MYKQTVNIFLSTFLISVLFFFLGCAEPDGPVGSQVGQNRDGEVMTVEIYADEDTSLAFPPPNTSRSIHLYVGSIDGVTSRALVKFKCPALPFEWSVDSSYVELAYLGGIGETINPTVGVTQLSHIWMELDTIDIDALPDGEELSVFANPSREDSGKVRIYPSVVDWMRMIDSLRSDTTLSDTAIIDSGLTIFLEPGPSNECLVDFCSRSAYDDTTTGGSKPRLFVYITARDSANGELHPDTLEVVASDDLFLLEYDTTAVNDNLTIGSGVSYRTFVRFDCDTIDTTNYHIVVNQATMTIHRKRTVEPWYITRSLIPFTFTGDTVIDFRDTELMKRFNVITAVDTSLNDIGIIVSNVAADWLQGKDANGWLGMLSGTEDINIDRISFHSTSGPVELCPKLTVHYTRFPR
ncbi:MAG: hypothetical protein P9X24_08935 [Candidatus Hatepunaea meridiana]|nr:hypothetical protein [Candidatus Hatepunaea meridiana]